MKVYDTFWFLSYCSKKIQKNTLNVKSDIEKHFRKHNFG